MTALQLNAEIYRAMSVIADDEGLLRQALKYLKKLATKKQDETLMTKEAFFAKIERAEEQCRRGEGIHFTNREEMNRWLNSL